MQADLASLLIEALMYVMEEASLLRNYTAGCAARGLQSRCSAERTPQAHRAFHVQLSSALQLESDNGKSHSSWCEESNLDPERAGETAQ